MLRTWRVPLVVLVGVSAALGPAGRASAEVSVTVDGGTSFASGRTVLVRYRGATPNGQLYLSQCWQGDGPTFDVATVCSTFNQTLGVTSAAEGDLDFDVFSGEEPSGSGVSCGPSTKESVKAYTTCYLRVAPDALDNTTSDVFVALDFSTAKPSDGAVINGTSVPASTTSSIAVTVDDPSADVAGSSPAPDASAAPADTPVGAAAPTMVTAHRRPQAPARSHPGTRARAHSGTSCRSGRCSSGSAPWSSTDAGIASPRPAAPRRRATRTPMPTRREHGTGTRAVATRR